MLNLERVESVMLLHKGFEPTGVLFVAHEGKNHRFPLNRRQIFGLMAQCSEALQNMEPGEWRRAHEEAA